MRTMVWPLRGDGAMPYRCGCAHVSAKSSGASCISAPSRFIVGIRGTAAQDVGVRAAIAPKGLRALRGSSSFRKQRSTLHHRMMLTIGLLMKVVTPKHHLTIHCTENGTIILLVLMHRLRIHPPTMMLLLVVTIGKVWHNNTKHVQHKVENCTFLGSRKRHYLSLGYRSVS